MFTQFFGNYLLNKGLVTSAQLSDALAVQKTTRSRLGVLAINAGYMTPEQVEAVHAEQQRVDKRIGDIACDMGFLTHDQVEELLSSQGQAHLQLGQALMNMGAMTNAEFASALNGYKEENSLSDVDFSSAESDKINEIITKFYDFSDEEDGQLYADFMTLLFKNIIRFIGDDFTPLACECLPSARADLAAAQALTGAMKCITILEASEAAYIGFGSRYAGEPLTEADELTDAANGEFLNLHNGLFAVNVSNETGKEIKLEPQYAIKNESISGKNVYRMPMVFPFGTVNFIISI